MVGNTVNDMTTNFGKLDKFEGRDFRRWQKKMHFLLTTLKKNDDYICRGRILNGMSDSLFDVYTNVESAKFESKCMAEDSSSKKFLVSNFNNYKMVDSRPVMEQYNELLRILGQYTQHGLKMDENNSGSSSNKKPKLECWKCGKTCHFKRDCRSGKKNNANAGGSGKGSKDQSQDQGQNLVPIWNRFIKYSVSLISEAFYVQVDAIAWWIDSGATTHVCKDRYRGGEYYDPVFFQSVGIIHETIAPYTPQQNGVAERKNRALKEMVNSMLSYSGLSEGFWGEAMLTACYLLNRIPNKRKKTTPYELCIEEDPGTYNEAMQSQDSTLRKEAIDDEIGSIMANNTWVLSDLPPGCKWIFKRKMKVDGTVDKFKARLVIQGFKQKEWIDYFDTYAPVARITTIRLLLALAAIHNLMIHQTDVKTTFLNGDLDKEVYMKQPKGCIMSGNEHKCVYSKFDDSGKGVIICLYVDDMLIFGTDQNQVDKTKKFLSLRFSMKDMGEADVILGIKIKRENKGIVITQSHYIEKILKKFNREDCSPVSTPMDPVEKLKPNTGKPID
nr:zinc finger, CCHC-type [Tanacetum cinerariifolium]